MKQFALILTAMLVCSCSMNPGYTGQQFVEDSPTFYLSLAPSFHKPCEYEIRDKKLVYREYSGLGGYGWGRRKDVATSSISQEHQDKIRALTLEAIADTISIEKWRRENDEMVVVTDGTTWYIQSDIGPFLSISTNNPESKAFKELLTLLNSILGRKMGGA